MTDSYEPIISKLRELREKSGLTYAQIAKNSNGELTESTVHRMLKGMSKRPSLVSIIALIKAMGFKTSDVFDDTVKVDVQAETPQVVVPTVDVNVYNQMIQMYKDIISTKDMTYNDIIKTKDRWIRLLFILLFIFMLIAAIFIGIDLSTGELGVFRY